MKSTVPILMLKCILLLCKKHDRISARKRPVKQARALVSNMWLKADPSKGKILKNHRGQLFWGRDSLTISPAESHLIYRYNAIRVLVWLINDTIKEEIITENNLGKHK